MEGETSMNLNPFTIFVDQLPYIFKSRLEPLDKTYLDGRFAILATEYAEEMSEAKSILAKVVDPESNESWDFHDVMNKPLDITEKYISKLFLESEKYIDEI